MIRVAASILVAAAILVVPAAVQAGTEKPPVLTSLESAKALAAEKQQPILLRFGKGWCASCNAFDKAVQEDPKLQQLLTENVVLCAIDISEGDGVGLARTYSVSDYPVLTFVLTDPTGEVMDRWMGFKKPEGFVEHLTAAVENPITVRERLERFAESPSEIDARKLGELHDYEGYYAEAVAYYRRASSLVQGSGGAKYDKLILDAMAKGLGRQLFDPKDVLQQADVVVASASGKPDALLELAYTMGKVGKIADDQAYFLPYLKVAIEQTEGVADEGVQMMRSNLLPEYALYIQKDVKKAVEYKKASFSQAAQPKDWKENANMLNNIAWWCFENKINLDEAETMARRGVELAKPGNQKANILDTLAEICNVKGDCGDAVEYIRLAVKEDPENEYFQKQLTRFEELWAAQTR